MFLGEKGKYRLVQNCVLCGAVPCDTACPEGLVPARQLRSIWFDNEKSAAARRGASIPILAKLTPNVARMSPAAEAALSGGADGLSAINTIKWIVPGAGHADAKNTAPKEYFTHVFDLLETYMRAD